MTTKASTRCDSLSSFAGNGGGDMETRLATDYDVDDDDDDTSHFRDFISTLKMSLGCCGLYQSVIELCCCTNTGTDFARHFSLLFLNRATDENDKCRLTQLICLYFAYGYT